MRGLPRKAQIYLITIYLLGIVTMIGAIAYHGPHSQAQRWEVVLFGLLAVMAGSKKICLLRHLKEDDAGSMSLGFCITFAAMIRFGPLGCVVIGLASGLSACLYPKRQPWHQLAFNIALVSIEGLGASIVFLALNNWSLHLEPMLTFKAIIASSLTYFILNTGAVAIIIALCTGGHPMRLWRQTFLWTAPSYFAGACITALALLIVGNHVGTVMLFLSPVAYLTYSSYATYVARVEEKQQHIEELQLSQAQLADLYLATIKSLALAIDAKDQYTHQHILRVQRYAVATAKQMGLTGGELEGVNTGALLHDIGKLGVPEYVLLKPGRLTEEEFAKIKKHPEIGAAILDPVEFPWPVLPAVMYHHEKWDGTGYPEGLKGENIPLQARILAVADVYDALTSTRSYRNAWTHEKAIGVIKKNSGTHFDPVVAEAFLQVIDGVVEEMAQHGEGPLVLQAPKNKLAKSKADEAALDIERASSELWALYEVAQTLSSAWASGDAGDSGAQTGKHPAGNGLPVPAEGECGGDAGRPRGRGTEPGVFQRLSHLQRPEYLLADDSQAGDLSGGVRCRRPDAECRRDGRVDAAPIGVDRADCASGRSSRHDQRLSFPGDAFGIHDRQLLETIAERAAMALYNGLLFDRTRSHAHTDPLTGLFNVRYLTQYVEDRCQKSLAYRHNHTPLLLPESGGRWGDADRQPRHLLANWGPVRPALPGPGQLQADQR